MNYCGAIYHQVIKEDGNISKGRILNNFFILNKFLAILKWQLRTTSTDYKSHCFYFQFCEKKSPWSFPDSYSIKYLIKENAGLLHSPCKKNFYSKLSVLQSKINKYKQKNAWNWKGGVCFFNILMSKKTILPEEYQNNRYCLLEKKCKDLLDHDWNVNNKYTTSTLKETTVYNFMRGSSLSAFNTFLPGYWKHIPHII